MYSYFIFAVFEFHNKSFCVSTLYVLRDLFPSISLMFKIISLATGNDWVKNTIFEKAKVLKIIIFPYNFLIAYSQSLFSVK